ncbi:MAG: hypothetical protein U9N59_10105, partial [Campylobacterota bacterium]|nr:hypothetical protein [Campylobacterota bacterium]
FFYKISTPSTLDYLEKVGGKELVTNYSSAADGQRISQTTEDELNATRIRALPRAGVAIIVAETLNEPVIVQTMFIPVDHEFDWSRFNKKPELNNFDNLFKDAEAKDVNYKTTAKPQKIEGIKTLEDSDLFGFKFESKKLS